MAEVPCNGCTLCCRFDWVLLIPGKDDIDSYEHLELTAQEDGSKIKVLNRRKDGACIYLDDKRGCTIYDRRPAVCKGFDCRVWFKQLTRKQRRERIAKATSSKEITKKVFERGRELLPTLTKT